MRMKHSKPHLTNSKNCCHVTSSLKILDENLAKLYVKNSNSSPLKILSLLKTNPEISVCSFLYTHTHTHTHTHTYTHTHTILPCKNTSKNIFSGKTFSCLYNTTIKEFVCSSISGYYS